MLPLFRVGEEKTANASWIILVLLLFEVLLHLRWLLQDCKTLHAWNICCLSDVKRFHFNPHGEIKQRNANAKRPELGEKSFQSACGGVGGSTFYLVLLIDTCHSQCFHDNYIEYAKWLYKKEMLKVHDP